jgi:potassium channel subfamily K protein
VCIAYAILGIPLMLLFLANVGTVLADLFRWTYFNFCCCGCFRRKKDKVEALTHEDGDKGHVTPEGWKKSFETGGKGRDIPPESPVSDSTVDDDYDDEEDFRDVSVPLTITMMIIAAYILLGALMFGIWENWTVLKSCYFCFVTVSTIGFGDVVPGSTQFKEGSDYPKLLLSACYMVFGMAIISMCFSLIQDEIASKFTWLGQKIGLIKKKDEDEEEEYAIDGTKHQ